MVEEACDSSEPAKGCISYEFLYSLPSAAPSATTPTPKQPTPPTFHFPSDPRNTTSPSASKRPPVPPVTTPTEQPSTSPAWVRKNDTRTPVTPQPEEPVR